MEELKAPFPYFGGKSRIADQVWQALGQPDHYLEPFFGSGAVLLARQFFKPGTHTETINDKDGFIANLWRALQAAPDEVAKYCDWPVNHADLTARKRELIKNEDRLLESLAADPAWFDPILAGYWIWAASCWIGSGLTREGQLPNIGQRGSGIHKVSKIPHIIDRGVGVHKKSLTDLPQIPFIISRGKGINTGIDHQEYPENGPEKDVREPYNTNLYTWFRRLSERLRYVRVVCGDWSRICGGNWQDGLGIAGIFFDPPYGATDRDTTVYSHDSTATAYHVRQWCLEKGKIKTYRIVLAGYEGEGHDQLLTHGWRIHEWTGSKGYAVADNGNENSRRERLYLSPHCFRIF